MNTKNTTFQDSLEDIFELIEKTAKLLDERLKNGEISEYEYHELKTLDFEIDDSEDEDIIEQFKEFYEKRMPVKCSELILKIFDKHGDSFRKAILLSECFPDPLGFQYTQEVHDFSIYVINRAYELANKKKYSIELKKELKQLFLALSFFNHNNLRNTEKLNSCEFMNYSLSEQVRMICIFLQDQNRLEQNFKEKEIKNQGFFTGMETAVSNRSSDDNPNVLVSFEDNFEGLVEAFDLLIRYLYFKKGKDYGKKKISDHGDITHIEVPSLELVTHIAVQRNLLEKTWEKFKYSQWKVSIKRNDEQDIYVFFPKYEEEYREHIIASNRRQYSLLLDMFKSSDNRKHEKGYGAFLKIASQINKDDIQTLFSFNIDDYNEAIKTYKSMINAYKSNMHPHYLEITIDDMKTGDLVKAFEFFHVLAECYKLSIYKDFDQQSNTWYKYLSPLIPIELFENEFSRCYGVSKEYSKKIINSFVFSRGIKSESDIFSRPLIAINTEQVIFCPVLLQQMNLERIIESLISTFNVGISKIGTDFEDRIKVILSFVQGISVNTSKIEFLAFDDRDVEFDFLGLFGDYLLLWEFKAMTVPYSDKKHLDCKKTIMEGVNQIERRLKVIQNDWDKIKELANIDLPDKPFASDKIIKLVGTNIFDFTTLIYGDDIRVVDDSTLLKFFVNPEVKVLSVKDKSVLDRKKIWSSSVPNANEFLSYLNDPVTTAPYNDCVTASAKQFSIFEGDYPYAIIDQTLNKNPYEEGIRSAFRQSNIPIKHAKSHKKSSKKKKNKKRKNKNKR